MAYGRKRYQRPINPEFKAGAEVDYVSGFDRHSRNTKTVAIDRVLGTGHAVVRIPNHDGSVFTEMKFRITGQDYASEVSDSRYSATIYLRTANYLQQRQLRVLSDADQRRRRNIGQELKEIPIYALTEEQMSVLEGIIQSFKKVEEPK